MLLFFTKLIFAAHSLTLGRILVSPDGEDCEDLNHFGRDRCVTDAMARYWYAAFWMWAILTTQGLGGGRGSGGGVYNHAGTRGFECL